MAVYFVEASGKWRGQVGSGKNRQTKSFTTKALAERWEREHANPETVDETTWNDIADIYFASLKFRDKTEKTKKGELKSSRPILKHFGKKLVEKIDDLAIDDYKDARLKTISPRTKKALAGNTVRLELAFLATLIKVALKRRIISANPLKLVEKPRCNEKRARISEQDLSRIFNDLNDNSSFFAFFYCLYVFGCRASELAELQYTELNIAKRQVYFKRTKNTLQRTVIVTQFAMLVIVNYLKREGRPSFEACPYVFASQKRNGEFIPYDFSNAWKTKKRQLAGAISDNISPHTFRHERISRWFECGSINEGQIMELSGHLTASALNRYRHLRVERLREIVTEIADDDTVKLHNAMFMQKPEEVADFASATFEEQLVNFEKAREVY